MQISALRAQLSSALLEFAWDEWAQMGVLAAPTRDRGWAQDPEALLLMTLEVARDDPRLFDEVLDWLVRNEPLVSRRRLRTLYDGPDDERLCDAVLAWVGQQRRPRAAGPGSPDDETEGEALFRGANLPTLRADAIFRAYGYRRPPVEPSGKSRPPDFNAAINFAFRLRQLLGVGARAEAARYLLTADVAAATVAEVGRAAGYSKRNAQEALTALHSAGVATLATSRGEQRYGVDRSRWAYLLGVDADELPIFRDWPTLLRALRRMLRWLDQPELTALSDYLLVSRAADLLDEIRPELNRAGAILPARIGGRRSWTDLEDTIKCALVWLAPDAGGRSRPAVFEIVPDAAEGYWWRLRTAAGRIVAASADAYASKSTARAAAERVRNADGRLTFRMIADAGAYRWHIVAENRRIVAASAEAFATEHDAERAARAARELIAGAASPSDLASTVVNRARRHVTMRPDGRWQVQAEGATRAASTHATQADAVRSARRQASNVPGGAEVIVHRRDGRIRSSEAVPTRE